MMAADESAATNGENQTTELEVKIIKQVEYYFGNHNLRRDKFLIEETKKDNGWVTMETLLKFNRLKQLSEDADFVLASLEKSENHLLEIDNEKKQIRRSVALPEDSKTYQKEARLRTVYAKRFAEETSLDELLDFFRKFGDVEHVSMLRMRDTKIFRGNVFVLYKTKEGAEAFMAESEVKYGDVVLNRERLAEYTERKATERSAAKKKAKVDEKEKNEKEELEKVMEKMVRGNIVVLEDLPPNSKISRESFKDYFNAFCPIAWIDFNVGEEIAILRFHGESFSGKKAVEKALEANDGKLVINNAELKHRLLEGEEEDNHWKGIFSDRKKKYENKNAEGARGGQRGRRGRGRGYRGRGGRGWGWREDRKEDSAQKTRIKFDGDEGKANEESATDTSDDKKMVEAKQEEDDKANEAAHKFDDKKIAKAKHESGEERAKKRSLSPSREAPTAAKVSKTEVTTAANNTPE